MIPVICCVTQVTACPDRIVFNLVTFIGINVLFPPIPPFTNMDQPWSPHGCVITSIINCGMKSLIHSWTSTVQPLKFRIGWVSHFTFYQVWTYLSSLGLTLNKISKICHHCRSDQGWGIKFILRYFIITKSFLALPGNIVSFCFVNDYYIFDVVDIKPCTPGNLFDHIW